MRDVTVEARARSPSDADRLAGNLTGDALVGGPVRDDGGSPGDDEDMSTETTRAEGGGAPGRASTSEHDAEELVERLRSAPAEEIITDLFSTLLSTAQVKLGRRDARLFIDLCAQMLDHAGAHVPEELGKQVGTALGQLRLAQVSAENEAARKGGSEADDVSGTPTPATGENRGAPDSGQPPAPPSSKLWVPGR